MGDDKNDNPRRDAAVFLKHLRLERVIMYYGSVNWMDSLRIVVLQLIEENLLLLLLQLKVLFYYKLVLTSDEFELRKLLTGVSLGDKRPYASCNAYSCW